MADTVTTQERGRLLTPEDVASRLEVSARHVRRLPPSELPYLALASHGRRRYDPRDVEAYIRRRMVRG